MDSSSEYMNQPGSSGQIAHGLPHATFNLKAILNASTDPTFIVDRSLRIVYLNDAAKRTLALIDDTIISHIGLFFVDIVPEDRRNVATVMLNQVLGGRDVQYETSYTLKAGDGIAWYDMNYRAIRDESGNVNQILITAQDISASKNREAALIKNEQRWKFIVEGDGNGVWETNFLTGEVYYSPYYKTMLGFDQYERVDSSLKWMERIHPEDLHKVTDLETLYERNIIDQHSVEFRIRKKNGEYTWVLNRGMVMEKLPDGKPLRLAGTQKDITTTRNTEEALYQSEERYYQMVDGIDDYAIVMLDCNGIVINWNKGAEKIKGYKSWEIIGKSFLAFYSQEDLEAGLPQSLLDEALRADRAFHEGWRLKKNGTAFWASVSIGVVRDKQGSVIGFSKITRDLTDKKIAEDKLVKSEAQFSSFMRNTPTMNWIIDEFAVFRYLNDSYMKHFGLGPEHIGKTIYHIFPTEICDAFVANNWVVWNTGKPLETYEEGVGPDGGKQFYHIYKFPLPQENGVKLLGGVSLDLTQQRILETDLASQEDRRKREIIQAIIDAQEKERKSIAYELHDNVNQILTSSRLMLEVAAEKPDSYSKFVNNSLLYLQSAIQEVRRISHSLAPSTLNDIGLEDAIDEIITDINNSGKLLVEYKKRILCSTRHLSPEVQLTVMRVVQEQLKNIIKHASADTATVILKNTPQRVSLRIQDDGKGFEVSSTKKGLGLNGIYNRTEFFNGRVLLDSTPGKGCTLIIHIPVNP